MLRLVVRLIANAANEFFLSVFDPIDPNLVEKVVVEGQSAYARDSIGAACVEKHLQVDLGLLVVSLLKAKGFIQHINQALVVGKGLLSCLFEVGILKVLVDAAKVVFFCFVIVDVAHGLFPEQPVYEVMCFLFVHCGIVLISMQSNTLTLPKSGKVKIFFQK